MRPLCVAVLLSTLFPAVSTAQQNPSQKSTPPAPQGDMQNMPGMDTSQMPGIQMGPNDQMNMRPDTFVQEILAHNTSGTSAEPDSTPVPMLMRTSHKWTLMFHANVFILDEQQSSPRGGDKFFSTNWLMGMAQRNLGPGAFTVRNMLTLEPATITDRRYPLLFQQGETAYGVPIADGQHPHDFVMELALLYDLKLRDNGLLSFYFAPVGDPAIGPIAYPHRASAAEDPVATLGHHQEDSTHVADDVITAGLTYRIVRMEVSGFHGREPDEFRWDIDQGKINSWSTRLTIRLGKNWSGQYSYSRITSPEALFPAENQERMTASIMYNRPLHDGNWANTLLWGRTSALQGDSIFNSYLFESLVRFRRRNYAWTRIENAERSNELIVGENPLPPGFEEEPIGHVQAYTLGYDRDFDWIPDLASALGAQFTAYGVPDTLKPIYGAHPFGAAVFVRLRPFSREDR